MLSFQNLILLSSIQGITEFLPISSSAHLIILPSISNNPDQGRVFDVAVHFGSLIAVLLYFWKDVFNMGLGFLYLGSKSKNDLKLFFIVIVASLPLIGVGYFIQKNNFIFLRSIEVIAWCTLIFGVILFLVDKTFLRVKKLGDINIKSGIIIGLFQTLAFLPGTSRSGITITAGRMLGFERSSAAKFSLLLSIPAILGATSLELYEIVKQENYELSINILTASLFSFIFSMLSIFFMMKWISNYSFTPFVIYRVLLGSILLLAIYFW